MRHYPLNSDPVLESRLQIELEQAADFLHPQRERIVRGRFVPNKVVALRAPGDEEAASAVPLLAGRDQLDGRPAAYVCRNFACRAPTSDPDELARQLDGTQLQ